MSGSNVSAAPGLVAPALTTSCVYWTPIGGTGTAPTSISLGAVCVPDLRQRSVYSEAGTARTAVNGTPDYTFGGGVKDPRYNVTVCNDDASVTAALLATRYGVRVYMGPGSLASGKEGVFAHEGVVLAQVPSGLSRGDRLSCDVASNTNAGKFKLAIAGDTVHAVLVGPRDSVTGLAMVELVPPSGTSTGGGA